MEASLVSGITLAWLTCVGIGTYRWEKNNGGATLPPPSLYIGAALSFTIIGLAGQLAPKPAQLFAWGLVVAAAVNGDFGKPATAAATQTKPKQVKAAKATATTVKATA